MEDVLFDGDVKKILFKELKGKISCICKRFRIFIADSTYISLSDSVLKEFLERSKTDRMDYKAGVFDCDDFADILKGDIVRYQYENKVRFPYVFGVVWGKFSIDGQEPCLHAINFSINENRKIRFIEPQTDEIFYPRKEDKKICFIKL